MNRFTRSIAMASARHPWRTIATWVVVLGAVFALAGSGGGGFIDAFSAKGSQSERALQLLEDKFPEATQASALVVFAVDDGETLQDQQQAVDAVLADVAGADHVVAVADPFASGTISDDGRIGYATLTLDETPAELGKGGFVPLTELVDASNTADLRVELGGDAVFLDAPDETSPLEGVGILIALLVLLVAFGTVVAALVPIGLALVAVAVGIGGIFVLAGAMDVSPSAIPIAGIVGLGVGIDYALFIVARYRENRAAGRDNSTALADAMSSSGAAVVFAGGTVVIAMASLAFTGLGALTSIGLATAIVVLSAVAAATTLLPALLGLLGDRIDTRPAAASSPPCQARRGDRLVALRPPRLGTPLALPGRCRLRPARLRRTGLRDADRLARRGRRSPRHDVPAGLRPAGRRLRSRDQRAAGGRRRPDGPWRQRQRRARAGRRHPLRPSHRLGQRAADLRGRQHRGLRGDADDGSGRSGDRRRPRRGP